MLQNSYTKEDTIFVQIASYRDPELQHTLQDLFKKAKRPENIFVGICHQYDMKGDEDNHLFTVPFPRKNQIRIDAIDYRQSNGCCFARNRVQKLWKNEKWTLMIDSHSRFEENWDEICVSIAKKYECDEKILLSSYVCQYFLDGKKEKHIGGTNAKFDKAMNIFIMTGMRELKKNMAFVSGHFMFSNSLFIKTISYDPHIYFMGEEISISVRAWTNGYKILNPNQVILYHLYRSTKNTSHRKIHEDKNKLNQKSLSRVQHLLNTKKTNRLEILEDIDSYNLGKTRTLRDYERFSGLDF